VKRNVDDKRYAMKEVNMCQMSQRDEEEALNEIRVLASFRHTNITKFKEAFINDDKLYIITELVEGGDLLVHVKRYKTLRKFIPENTIWSYFIQICQGLAFLHEKNGFFFFYKGIFFLKCYIVILKVLMSLLQKKEYVKLEIWVLQRF
jgi:NIMA (never in mitosis gene a)-related kinase